MSVDNFVKKIDIEDAKKNVSQYDYALIYQMSDVIFDKVVNIPTILWDEIVEAYFFNEKCQLHIYNDECELKAVEFNESSGEMKKIEKIYDISRKFAKIGSRIKIVEYLDNDEDGQIFVAYTRMATVE